MKKMIYDLFTPLSEAINWVRAERGSKGSICPCCDQVVKQYKRKVNSSNAVCMIEFHKFAESDKWYHITDLIKHNELLATRMNGGEFARMRFFGLIEEMEKKPECVEKRTSGYWKITEKGRMFVRKEITVPAHVIMYNGQVIGFSEEHTDIIGALGTKFNYQELMDS